MMSENNMYDNVEYGDDETRRQLLIRTIGAKSFIKLGNMWIDLKHCFGFGFEPDPEGYILFYCCSVYDVNNFMYIEIPDRNQLSLFFLELENFIDDENLLCNLTALIDEIDAMAIPQIHRMKAVKKKPKKPKSDA